MFRTTLFALITFVAIPAHASGLLEPCINGDVSASGSFPTQKMENESQFKAYLAGRLDEPPRLAKAVSQYTIGADTED